MPIEKDITAERRSLEIDSLLERCRGIFYSPRQQFKWKHQIADDLNYLLGRATAFLETSADESDIKVAEATLRIVKRVEEFEGIRRAK